MASLKESDILNVYPDRIDQKLVNLSDISRQTECRTTRSSIRDGKGGLLYMYDNYHGKAVCFTSKQARKSARVSYSPPPAPIKVRKTDQKSFKSKVTKTETTTKAPKLKKTSPPRKARISKPKSPALDKRSLSKLSTRKRSSPKEPSISQPPQKRTRISRRNSSYMSRAESLTTNSETGRDSPRTVTPASTNQETSAIREIENPNEPVENDLVVSGFPEDDSVGTLEVSSPDASEKAGTSNEDDVSRSPETPMDISENDHDQIIVFPQDPEEFVEKKNNTDIPSKYLHVDPVFVFGKQAIEYETANIEFIKSNLKDLTVFDERHEDYVIPVLKLADHTITEELRFSNLADFYSDEFVPAVENYKRFCENPEEFFDTNNGKYEVYFKDGYIIQMPMDPRPEIFPQQIRKRVLEKIAEELQQPPVDEIMSVGRVLFPPPLMMAMCQQQYMQSCLIAQYATFLASQRPYSG